MFAANFCNLEPMNLLESIYKLHLYSFFLGPVPFIKISEEEAECFLDWDNRVADLRNTESLLLRHCGSGSLDSSLPCLSSSKPTHMCSVQTLLA